MPNSHPSGNYSTDELLVASVMRNNLNAFEELVRLNERLVISIVFKMIPQREDAEDLCQDVFLKVYQKLPSFKFQSKLSTWIGTIAFNSCINFLKKYKPDLIDGIDLHGERRDDNFEISIRSDISPHEQLENKERQFLLSLQIEKLSMIQKTILQLFHFDELSLLEISAIISLPLSTVKSHLFRARQQLKDHIQKINSYGN